MATIRHTSTRNIKPTSISTAVYVGKYTYGGKYGESLFGSGVYGALTYSSGGQKMPAVDTRVI